MVTDRRQVFLESFLSLYGVDKISISKTTDSCVEGTAFWTYEDDEGQDFRWKISADNVPPDDLISLILVIRDNKFNSTDKINASADEIFKVSKLTDRKRFDLLFEDLFEIEVMMLDDGEETDSFFLHD